MPSRRVKPKTIGKAKKLAPLNNQQELFVREYCVDLDANKAALRAGYSSKRSGEKLMTREHVLEAIRLQIGKRARETEIDAERVLCELALIAFSNPKDMFDENGCMLHIKDMPDDIAKTIASLDVVHKQTRSGDEVTIAKVRFHNKLEALALIGKHLGILGSQVEQKHLHLHSVSSNPYLNAPDDVILQAKSALANLEYSVRGNIMEEDNDR